MSEQGSITFLMRRLQAGESFAAASLWDRYYERLVRLASQKLGGASRRMADEEDAVVIAFSAFLKGVEQGRFPKLEDRDDLWQILVMLTARKAANHRQHEQRQRRGEGRLRGESVFMVGDDELGGIDQIAGAVPTAEFAGQVSEECRELFDRLGDEILRRIAVAKMEGYTNDEIAQQLNVQTRTIERKLRLIREIWSQEGKDA
ncbi:MAG: ECF-type sigma factor [Pirellulales bacterium]